MVRAIYGCKSAASSWRAAISKVIEDLGFKMCRADNDVFYRPGKNAEGMDVYEYVLLYSDDLLVVARDPEEICNQIGAVYKLKEGSCKPPT